MALAGGVAFVDLESWQTAIAAWFVIFFAWTSTLAILTGG